MSLSSQDIQVLRELGARYMEYASLPIQQKKVDLWKALNRGKMERPMVVLDQYPWDEMNQGGELTCLVKDPFWAWIELGLRRDIYQWEHCAVDMVLEPYITIPLAIRNSGYSMPDKTDRSYHAGEDSVAGQHYNRIIKTMDDVSLIKDMIITHDESQSKKYWDEAHEIFDGTAPLVQSHGTIFHLGIWDKLSTYIGMEDVYYELMDNPDLIHACMERLTQATIAGIEQANKLKIHNDIAKTCHCAYVYNDDLLPGFNQGRGALSQNSWAFGMAQLFTSVSPAITEEFETPYISRIAEYFGMIYYGCCEREDDRLDLVKQIPHVQKISCSPWNDKRNFASQLGPKLTMSNKPSPAFVATDSVDWALVEKDLRETMEIAREEKVNLEFILKDISTVRNDPSRLTKWAEVAMKVVESY
jgi:hypothetical protein